MGFPHHVEIDNGLIVNSGVSTYKENNVFVVCCIKGFSDFIDNLGKSFDFYKHDSASTDFMCIQIVHHGIESEPCGFGKFDFIIFDLSDSTCSEDVLSVIDGIEEKGLKSVYDVAYLMAGYHAKYRNEGLLIAEGKEAAIRYMKCVMSGAPNALFTGPVPRHN